MTEKTYKNLLNSYENLSIHLINQSKFMNDYYQFDFDYFEQNFRKLKSIKDDIVKYEESEET